MFFWVKDLFGRNNLNGPSCLEESLIVHIFVLSVSQWGNQDHNEGLQPPCFCTAHVGRKVQEQRHRGVWGMSVLVFQNQIEGYVIKFKAASIFSVKSEDSTFFWNHGMSKINDFHHTVFVYFTEEPFLSFYIYTVFMFVFLFCFYPTGCFLIHLLKYIKRNQEVSAFSGMRSVQPMAVCTYTDICTQEQYYQQF